MEQGSGDGDFGAGGGQDGGLDENDVTQGDKGRNAADDFAVEGRAVLLDFEVRFEGHGCTFFNLP